MKEEMQQFEEGPISEAVVVDALKNGAPNARELLATLYDQWESEAGDDLEARVSVERKKSKLLLEAGRPIDAWGAIYAAVAMARQAGNDELKRELYGELYGIEVAVEQSADEPISDNAVASAFAKLAEKGAKRPSDVAEEDPDGYDADLLMGRWMAANPEIADTGLREMLLVKAGFTDPEFLEELAHGRLTDDLKRAEEEGNTKLASMLKAAIGVLEEMLGIN